MMKIGYDVSIRPQQGLNVTMCMCINTRLCVFYTCAVWGQADLSSD